MVKYGISFAIGGLLGDVFFHTLPHLKEDQGQAHGHGHDHGHDHHGHDHHGHSHDHDAETSFVIILGILGFFLIEKMTHDHLAHDHDHGHKDSTVHDEKSSVEQKTNAGKAAQNSEDLEKKARY